MNYPAVSKIMDTCNEPVTPHSAKEYSDMIMQALPELRALLANEKKLEAKLANIKSCLDGAIDGIDSALEEGCGGEEARWHRAGLQQALDIIDEETK